MFDKEVSRAFRYGLRWHSRVRGAVDDVVVTVAADIVVVVCSQTL